MATIDDLNQSISEMSTEELNQRILDLRKSRRIPKKVSTTKSKSAKSTKPADITSIMNTMSKEELQKLLTELEG